MDDQTMLDQVRAIWLGLFDRAMRETWDDRQSWEAAKAMVTDVNTRFGVAGVRAFNELERKAYRLFTLSPAVDDVEDERRRAHRVARR